MDRENVIADIEEQIAWIRDNDFHKFPGWGHAVLAMKDALALLKEQEAVKPKSKSRHGEYPQIVHRCGNCNEILYRYYKHCPTCGRSVKWE